MAAMTRTTYDRREMGNQVHSVAAQTHGRVLVRDAIDGRARGILAGFHGYLENAAIQMARLEAIPGAEAWTLVSVQALHRVYRGRSQDVVASWMTREDREQTIADNIAYVDAAIDLVAPGAATGVIYAGFSQGVAMAFRAALRGRVRGAGVIAVGGDVPPELLPDTTLTFPPLLIARGAADEWYTAAKFDADLSALASRAVVPQVLVYDAGHAWTAAVAEAAGRWLARFGAPSR
jgi:predicted esterase